MCLSNGRRARPVVLRRDVGPDGTRWEEANPSFCQFAVCNAVNLSTSLGVWLARLRISPLERKAEPSTGTRERMVVDDYLNAWTILLNSSDLCDVGIPSYLAITLRVVPCVGISYASGRQIELAFVPYLLPAIEEVGHNCIL